MHVAGNDVTSTGQTITGDDGDDDGLCVGRGGHQRFV